MRILVLFAAMVIAAQPGSAFADDAEARAYLGKYELPPPTATRVVVCHGFACKYRTAVALGGADIARLRQILNRGRQSPQAEIDAIANAVSWFERRIGPITGMDRRTPRAGHDEAGLKSEADCIDLSVNTTTLLLLLSDLELLRHHEVVGPESRGYLFDMRYPHATAVVENRKNGSRWAIDSWPKRNGERPDTLLLERWMAGS